MVVVFIDQVIAIDFRIHGRHVLQGLDNGFGKETHEAQFCAVLLFENVLELVAQRHDRGHVHFIESGEHGGGVLGFLQAPGDGEAKPGHLHALFGA